VGQVLFTLMRPVVFAHHTWALNKVRRDYGLPSVGYSLPHVFTDADETLYADLPELVPTFGRPDNHHYLGPVLWSPDIRLPWWNSLPEDQPIAYVSLGSSGRNDLLALVVQALDALGIRALVSTAGKVPPPNIPNHVWMSDYIPGLKAAERANFVICNGGSATVYQALAAGVPILGIPSNLDQYLMMDYVQRSKAGVYVRAGQASIARLTETARDLVQNLHYRCRAESFKTLIQTGPCGTPLDTILSRYLGMDPSDASLPPVGQTPTHPQDNHRTPLSGMTTHSGRPSHVGSVPLTDRAETEGAPP
jgi:UDP:flavonoid glycosyltransferase YjiC (YdhE family)